MVTFILSIFNPLSISFGVEVYSKNEKPFDIPPNVWIGKWWNWWIDVSTFLHPDNNPNVANKCLIHSSDPMVMLMETTVKNSTQQVCKISREQGIMIPLWTSFQENSINKKGESAYNFSNTSNDELTNVTKALFDTGEVKSYVKVDGAPVAELWENTITPTNAISPTNEPPKESTTTVNSMRNVVEIWSKPFNITIPVYTYAADQNAGTWPAGAHGWITFLKPLPPGDHIIEYETVVSGENPQKNRITYKLNVE